MNTLISMIDFVLKHKHKTGFKSELERLEYYYSIYKNYATFLKQPLTLGMFVPCDENGTVLEFPIDTTSMRRNQKIEKYNKAKEKVLFKGFEADRCSTHGDAFYLSSKNGKIIYTYNKPMPLVEWLLMLDFEIELTESAINQIGL